MHVKFISPLSENAFNKVGGKAMGLIVLDSLSKVFPEICNPRAYIIPFSNDFEGFLNNFNHVLTEEPHPQKLFSVKASTTKDDFSRDSHRGINSSRGKKICLIKTEIEKAFLELKKKFNGNVKSLIFQELVCKGVFFILHYDKSGAIWEVVFNEFVCIYKVSTCGRLVHYECSNKRFEEQGYFFIKKLQSYSKLLNEVRCYLGFDFNTEGFLDEKLCFVQLRPIPPEFHITTSIQKDFKPYFTTNLLFGFFDFTIHRKDLINIESNIEKHIEGDKKVYVNHTTKLPLEYSHIRDRVSKGLFTTVLNTATGFYLSHSNKHIPDNLTARNFFNCMTVDRNKLESLDVFRVVSDGYKASIYKVQ